MRKLLTFILMVITFSSFSQNYPHVEVDSSGRKIVVMTVQQAQKIDNNLEILGLLEKAGVECDSLNKSYLSVIDSQGNQIKLLELDVKTLKSQIMDKDSQISNLQQQLSNSEESNSLCEQQKVNYNEEIKNLKKEVRRQKLQKFGGFVVGAAAIVGGVVLYFYPH
jgi:peptidoglycan hydrolase CwlO-like protein